MTKSPYAYTVVAYVHDPVAGERLNCALLFYAPSEQVIRCLTSRYSLRMDQAFGRFARHQHERMLSELSARTEVVRVELAAEGTWPSVNDFSAILDRILRDRGLSYQSSPIRFGLSADVAEEAEELFDRLVESQRPITPSETKRRKDDDVWRSFRNVAKQREALRKALQPVKLRGRDVEFEFRHAVKNGKYHVIQPVSFDVATGRGIAEKAAQWVGKGIALQDSSELEQIILLVGAPSDPDLHMDYRNAISFLRHGIPAKHSVRSEEEAEKVADELEQVLAHE